MATYLPPVEKPRGLLLKMVYFFTRRQFGRVASPIAVFSARMPTGFLSFYGKVSRLDKKLQLPSQTAVVIRERVASINSCLYCMDAARWFATRESADNVPRFDVLAEYRTSPLFTDAERAALDYATELTSNKDVAPDTFVRLARHYSEREDLRHRVARRQRAPVQHEQHRSQHRLGRPLRATAGARDPNNCQSLSSTARAGISAPHARSMARSAGQGPPTLTIPVPRSARTAWRTLTGTWMTSPAENFE